MQEIKCVGCGLEVVLPSLPVEIVISHLGWDAPGGEPLCGRCLEEIAEDLEKVFTQKERRQDNVVH